MKLASVRALKNELLDVRPAMVESVASTRAFSGFGAGREVAARTMRGIALGVSQKKNQFRLAVRLQQSGRLISAMTDQIRQMAGGEADIQFVGNLVKFARVTQPAYYQQRRRPLRIGSSISDVHANFDSAGTLGCFVVRRRSPFYIGMLTNNHVIADENRNARGRPLIQPGTLDDGTHPAEEVGELGKFARLKKNAPNFIDAAIGDLYDEIDYDPRKIGSLGSVTGLGNVVERPAHATVHKVGRTTGQTEGRITAIEIDNVHVEYDMGILRFDNQIEIEGSGSRAFSDSGDSGSLIVDQDCLAIALLFAGGDQGGSNGKGLTYANPIETVIDALKVDLER